MIVLLIPYRDREANAKIFIEHILNFFNETKQGPVIIIIVEQIGERAFNRGALLNVGFLEVNKILKNTDTVIYVAHDIDMLPVDNSILYTYMKPNSIVHLYGPEHSLGGICSFNKSTYEKINGFPNNYWGWGREDVCILERAKHNGIIVDKSNFNKRVSPNKFREILPEYTRNWPKGDYEEKNRLLQDEIENPIYYKYNGLSTIQYIVKDTQLRFEDNNTIIFQKVYLF
jgi:hypothetical protein